MGRKFCYSLLLVSLFFESNKSCACKSTEDFVDNFKNKRVSLYTLLSLNMSFACDLTCLNDTGSKWLLWSGSSNLENVEIFLKLFALPYTLVVEIFYILD